MPHAHQLFMTHCSSAFHYSLLHIYQALMGSINANFYSRCTKLPVSHFLLCKRLRAALECTHVFYVVKRRTLIGNQLAEKAQYGCSPTKTESLILFDFHHMEHNLGQYRKEEHAEIGRKGEKS